MRKTATMMRAILMYAVITSANAGGMTEYRDRHYGFSLQFPRDWKQTTNVSYGKAIGFGEAYRSNDGRDVAKSCSVAVLAAPSSRGKSSTVIDREIDQLVRSTPPGRLAESLGFDAESEVSAVTIAERRALRVIVKKVDDVSGLKLNKVQTMILRDGQSYQIICTATEPEFAGAWKVFDGVANSFQFLPSGR